MELFLKVGVTEVVRGRFFICVRKRNLSDIGDEHSRGRRKTYPWNDYSEHSTGTTMRGIEAFPSN
jgi:hypothetical protein